MTLWHIKGRHASSPLPADWKARLVARLGHRPRRLGEWAEMALYGALACMGDAGEERLDNEALLSVSSLHGPDRALRAALQEAREGLPLPIGFLNSQPNQVLPTLSQYLAWQGNGRSLSSRDPLATVHLATLEAGSAGMLLGWVDEDAPGQSFWLRVAPVDGAVALRPGTFADLGDESIVCLAFERRQLLVGNTLPPSPG